MHLHARDPNVIPCMCSPRPPRLTALPEGGEGTHHFSILCRSTTLPP